MYSFKDYQREANDIQDYLVKECPQARNILDVACGTGKHAQYLSEHYQVDGIDSNPSFIETASIRNPNGQFYCKDMMKFQLPQQYDVVLCLFSSIAYVKSFDGLVDTLVQLYNHVKPTGYLIVEPWFAPDTWESERYDMLTVEDETHKICRMSHTTREGLVSILHFQYLISSRHGIEHYKERHELGLFSNNNMLQAFQMAGFTCEYDSVGISGRGLYVAKVRKA
ncbi:MAG: class I SAM-dependent methyltransferase [Paenibacillaceae bacterium]